MIIKIKDEKKHVIFCARKNILNTNNTLRKAIFFDRDGVLIRDMHYIKDPMEVSLLRGVNEILNQAKKHGYLNIIITNQSGISKKLFTWEDYERSQKNVGYY